MVASEIRALFAVAARPEIVSLAGGSPYVSALPLDAVGEMIGQLIADHGAIALQYCTAQGDAGLRERICDIMALEGIRAHPDEIVVTVGSQQALDLLTRIFIDPGDVILAEAPSYVGALGAFASYQATVVHVAMDERRADSRSAGGSHPAHGRAPGKRAKFLYTVPNFHNPAGVTLAAARRPRSWRSASARACWWSRTTPTACSASTASRMRALRADDDEGVVYLGTFSKTFARGRPGRLGGRARRDQGQADPGRRVRGAVPLQLLPADRARVPDHPALARADQDFRELYRERRDATLSALDTMMPPGCHWTRPGGGFYVWLRLPDGIDAKAMLPRAISSRVAYVPGTGFYADGSGGQYARLCYSLPRPGPDPRGGPPAGLGDRDRDPAAGRLRARPWASAGWRESCTNSIGWWCWPAACPPSGRSRCARVSGSATPWPRPASTPWWPTPTRELLTQLRADPPSAVFPVIHGASGEDGAIREVLGLLGMPYVGSVASACQMAFDKPTAKALVGAAGVATPQSVTLPRETFHDLGAAAVIDLIIARLGLPLYVKPSRGGSALGAGPVHTAAELPAALLGCFAYGDIALIERFISGIEVTVGVIDLGRGPLALPPVEIVPGDGGLRLRRPVHRRARRSSTSRPGCAGEIAAQAAQIAITAHTVLGLRDLSRTDLIVDETGTPYFLEVNVSPGMTETSTLPMALEASGHAFGTTCVSLLQLAAARRT